MFGKAIHLYIVVSISIMQGMDDWKWFKEHLKELRAKYEGKLVAVLNEKVVAVGESLDEIGTEIVEKKRAKKLRGTPFIGKAAEDTAVVRIPSIYL